MSKKILFEDLVQHQNKWTGAAQMSQKKSPEMMTIVDILARDAQGSAKQQQHPNNAMAPAPDINGESPLLALMGDLMIQNEEIKKVIRKVATSPVITDNTKAKSKLNAIMNKLVAIDNIVKKAGEDIDNFKVEIVDV
tara:strand:- start:316 stop:726 length:411 start_codon:yes stop_codon:yes gene_type:complete